MANRVRFVRFNRRLAEIIGVPAGESEVARQAAIEAVRDRILAAESDCQDEDMRIIIKTQKTVWRYGVQAGRVLRGVEVVEAADAADEGEVEEDESAGC